MAEGSLQEKIKDFFALFQSGPLIGLDIGMSAVKIAHMTPARKGTYKLEKYASVSLAEAAIIDDDVQRPEEVIEAIQNIISDTGLSKYRITNLGMDGKNTVTKRLQVPDAAKEDLEDNIIWEAEQYISFGAEESDLDYAILGLIEEEEVQDVVVAAAKSDVVEQYTEIATEAGLIVKNVDMNVFAINNLFEVAYADRLETLSEEGCIIIEIGAQTTTIIVYKNGGPILTKEINIGGVLITEEVQRQMEVSYEEAEDLKMHGDENGNLPEEIVQIINNFLDNLIAEIKKVLNFYISAGSSEKIDLCFICGGSSRLPGVAESIEDVLEIAVEVFDPFQKITFDKKAFSDEELESIAACGIVAMGLALRKI